MRAALLVLTLLLLTSAPGLAEELTVGIKEAPPFVIIEEGEEPRGFSVDLARQLAAKLDPPREIRFVVHDDLPTHLAAVAAGDVDMGIGATSVTAEREAKMDFSHGYFRDALDIVVPERDGGFSLWEAIRDSGVPNVLLGLAVFVLVAAHIVWLVERGRGGLDEGYVKGVGEGVWWSIVTMSTVGYGDLVPKTAIGRVLGVIVIFAGIVVFGIAVASLTAAATAQSLDTPVRNVGDVRNEKVLALTGSIAERELRQRALRVQTVPDLAAGLEGIRAGKAAAFVHDRSQLLHALKEDAGGIVLVGTPFAMQDYAVSFPLQSPLRKQVNIALRELTEGDGAPYDALVERWFPED